MDNLYTPFKFSTGINVAGVYIYSEAPDYHLVGDVDEGFTCIDDVARALQVYIRKNGFASDTAVRNKVFNLIRFILEMQSSNGYFYNFLFPDLSINKSGPTSINKPNWWSWRALYALSEAGPGSVLASRSIQRRWWHEQPEDFGELDADRWRDFPWFLGHKFPRAGLRRSIASRD